MILESILLGLKLYCLSGELKLYINLEFSNCSVKIIQEILRKVI